MIGPVQIDALSLMRERQTRCAVVIPAYNAEREIGGVVRSLPDWICRVFVVDDGSIDDTSGVVEGLCDPRVRLLRQTTNTGVGGAMVTGYKAALDEDLDVIIKMDSDGQMAVDDLITLVTPLLLDMADYVKGNRFRASGRPRSMPRGRWLGNVTLSFLNKVASGYWHVFDPQCGYTAALPGILSAVDLNKIAKDYFFENDMLVRANVIDARVVDVATQSVYKDEQSHLSIGRIALSFPLRLLGRFFWRVTTRHLVWDFGLIGAMAVIGLLLCLFGAVFGAYHWWQSVATGVTASTGTVMLAVLPLIVGVQLLLQALSLEVIHSPGADETRAFHQLQMRGIFQTAAATADHPGHSEDCSTGTVAKPGG